VQRLESPDALRSAFWPLASSLASAALGVLGGCRSERPFDYAQGCAPRRLRRLRDLRMLVASSLVPLSFAISALRSLHSGFCLVRLIIRVHPWLQRFGCDRGGRAVFSAVSVVVSMSNLGLFPRLDRCVGYR
jgi:hypothetical protein